MLQDLDIPGALWREPDMWARIALDMSFYTIIPLVLLSIISGIIIDGQNTFVPADILPRIRVPVEYTRAEANVHSFVNPEAHRAG